MSNWKEGDRVRIVKREVSDEDRKTNRYFNHMAGLEGVIQNVYESNELAVKVDASTLSKLTADVHEISATRMRSKLDLSEEARKLFTKEELEFVPHFMLLVQSADLEKV